MFAIKCESFFTNDEAEYDVFEFDGMCYTFECLIACLIPLLHVLT